MKVAVVTGASSGIGLETARKLLENSYKVYGVSRSEPKVESENFTWIEADLSQTDDISKIYRSIVEKVDVLISNAGIAFEEAAADATSDSMHKMFNTNVFAPIALVSALKSKLEKATIISVSSVSDRIVGPMYALYCSSKAANTRYFEVLATEMDKAKVFTVLPSYVDTPMLRELQQNNEFDWSETLHPSEVASVINELAIGNIDIESGANVIVVNDNLKEDLDNPEKLYGYNVSNSELIKL